jgi:hypothetical protein
MPDLDIITAAFCSSYWGVYEVPSASGPGKHTVTLDGEAEAHCTCPGYEFSKADPPTCRHIKQVNREACLWNNAWGGQNEVKLEPIGYHYGPAHIKDMRCPNCAAHVCPKRVAV